MHVVFKTTLITVFAFSASAAPMPAHEVDTAHAVPGLKLSSMGSLVPTTAENFETPPTPPLTRPPSLENAEAGGNGGNGVAIVFPWQDNTTNGEEENSSGQASWLRNLVSAVMVAVRFLVAPPHVTAGQRCRGDDISDDHGGRASLWKRTKDAVRDVFDKAAEKICGAKDKFLELFDDPVAKAARLVDLARLFKVRDMPHQTGHKRHGSGDLFKCDQHRLGAAKGVAAGVKQMCFQVAAEFPEIGYNQGFDAAAKAIFLCVGQDIFAAVQVFCKWAVPVSWLLMNEYDEGKRAIQPAMAYTWSVITKRAAPVYGWLSRDPVVGCDTPQEMVETILEHIFFEPLTTCCSRLGFTKRVMDDIIEETIKAGINGPAVTIFVVMSLLCLAEKRGVGGVDELVMMKVHLRQATKTVRSFKALEKEAPISLEEFLIGYREATANTPACDLTTRRHTPACDLKESE